jgi:hypothetical protein
MRTGEVVDVCNPSTQESEAGGLRVPGQSRLHSLKKNKSNKTVQ